MCATWTLPPLELRRCSAFVARSSSTPSRCSRAPSVRPGRGWPGPSEAETPILWSQVRVGRSLHGKRPTIRPQRLTPLGWLNSLLKQQAVYRGAALGFSSSRSTLFNALSRSSRACCSLKAASINLGGISSPPRNAFRNRGSALRGRPGGEGSSKKLMGAEPRNSTVVPLENSARVIRGRSAWLRTHADERSPRRNCSRSGPSPCCLLTLAPLPCLRRHLLCG